VHLWCGNESRRTRPEENLDPSCTEWNVEALALNGSAYRPSYAATNAIRVVAAMSADAEDARKDAFYWPILPWGA